MLQQTEKQDKIIEQLGKIVGKEFVSNYPEELLIYSYDMTEHPPHSPDYVVMPQTVEEIQDIMKLANKNKIPVVPFVTGANIGGLTIPQKGGLIVDLKRMDRILHVNTDDMYMIIEPGVTFGHVNKCFKEDYPDFRYCYPFAPPFASVAANALLGGLNNLSLKYGCMSEVINGIEAVLPNGKLVKIGTCMCWDDQWWGRAPMPDLLGLFTCWQGMSGIVTKIALQIWPRKPIRDYKFIVSNDLMATYKLVKKLARTEIMNDILLTSIETMKMALAVPLGKAVHIEGEPRWATILDFSANTQKEYEAKAEIIENTFKELKAVDPKAAYSSVEAVVKMFGEKFNAFRKMPMTIGGMLEYGGLTWVGTYMTSNPETVVKGVHTAFDLIEKYNFEKCLYTRMMKGGHYYAFRFLLRFSKETEGETERMRQLNQELFESLFELGAFPYKTPAEFTDQILERCDKNWAELLKTVKNAIDPNMIMNPGRWGFK